MKKKYSLLMTIMIAFLLVVVLSWIIPGGAFSSGVYAKGDVTPLGLGDLTKVPLWTFSTIFQFSLIFLVIGGFYGVLNKTGVYKELVEKTVKKFKKNSKIFLIITVASLAIISSVMGGNTYLFILVPFLTTVLLKLGYGKKASILATVGSLFVGTIGATYAFDVNGYVNYYLGQEVNAFVWYKIILLVLSSALLIMFLIKWAPKEEKAKEEEIPLLVEEKGKAKKSFVPLVVITVIGIIMALVGTFSWSDMYGTDLFTNLHSGITEFTIFGYPILANIMGTIYAIGNWSTQDVNVILIVCSLLIGWIYSIKFKDLLDSFLEGAKEMLPVFLYATLTNIVIVILMNSSTGNFINYTIINYLYGLSDSFNALIHGLVVGVDSFFVNFFPYMSSDVLNITTYFYTDATTYPVIGLITQAVYGLVMYVFPTSLLLVAGLAYQKVSYKEWLKYIWKYLLYLLAIIVAIVIIALSFI
ncbi:MAG: hypothetical protein PHD02_00190 [Bacilli bacterium]|nr:hypothetical protein [Bacilli bacterium]